MWAHVAVYAVAALVAAVSGVRERSGFYVAAFLAYMAVEAPLRAWGLPLAVDRFVVVGWDAAFLVAVAAVMKRPRMALLAAALWPAMTVAAMHVPDPLAWIMAWHATSVVLAVALLGRYSRDADPVSVGILVMFVAVDLVVMFARVGIRWEVLRLSSSLSPAMAIALYVWRLRRPRR